MVITTTPWSSNTAPSSRSSFGFPTSSDTGTVFGVSNTPGIDFKSTPGFGFTSSNSSIFGVANPSAFATGFTTGTSQAFPSTTPGFGIKSNSANASKSSVFGATNSPAFFTTGSTTSTSSAFPSTTSWFGVDSTNTSGFRLNSTSMSGNNNIFGINTTGPTTSTSYTFPSTSMSGNNNIFGIKSLTESQGVTKLKPTTGSRLSPYSATCVVVEVSDKKCTEKFQSISAMPVYEAKSHEELRLEDYVLLPNKGDGSKNCDIQCSPFQPVKPNNNLFDPSNNTTLFPNPFSLFKSSPFSPQPSNSKPNPFSPLNSNPSPFQPQPSNAKPNPFSITNSNPSPSQPDPFNAKPNPFSLPDPNPSLSQPQPFNATLKNSKLTSIVSPSTQSTTSVSALGPWPSIFNSSQPAGITGSVFINNPSQPSQTSSSLKVENEVGYPYNNGPQQQYAPPSTMDAQSSLVADPFPKRSEIERPNTVLTSVQHGISSLPTQVSNKLSSNRSTPLLRIRHVSSRLNSLPPHHTYTTPSSEPKVAFFHNEVDRPGPFLPRKNPRAWVTNSLSSFNYSTKGKCCEDKDLSSTPFQLNTYVQEATDHISATSISYQNDDGNSVIIAKKHEASVLSLIPKLPKGNGYYTEPSLNELAANEMDEPGSLSRVNGFVVGKSGYGSIKFLGETDVRHLDLGSVVQFNNREVIVYADEKTKPAVGKGMNKPAEVTLLNVKCVSKKTGKRYVDGPRVQSYKEMLMKKASEQGAEFVSYDPVRGEWKFRVMHF